MLRQDISETELRRLSDEELKTLDQKVRSIRETVKDEQHYGHRMREGSASEVASELGEKIDSCLQHGRLEKRAAGCAELAVKVLLPQQTGRLGANASLHCSISFISGSGSKKEYKL